MHSGVELFALPMAKPSIDKDDPTTWPEHAMVSPFWWVGAVQEKKDANMDFTTIAQHGIEVPVLCSGCDIAAHTRLVDVVKPKANTEPLQNVIKTASCDAPPCKRARR